MSHSKNKSFSKLHSAYTDSQQDFLPFIKKIWFPHYKSLEQNLELTFDWPITAIVGPNGTNKSSILHALDSAPEGRSIARYWYSTPVDDIDAWGLGEGEQKARQQDPHRFVYSYKYDLHQPEAECRKARVERKYRGNVPRKWRNRSDPDYWEPTKIVISDRMKPLPEQRGNPYLHSDRWSLIKKNIIYLDFRAEASAYNKFIDHGKRTQHLDTDLKRRIKVRDYSASLRKVLTFETSDKSILRKVEDGPRDLSFEAVEAVSAILGKSIEKITVVEHSLFGAAGLTFRLTLKDVPIEYSEAHAGSGEFNIIRLVDEISRAARGSLILLDEPEVSLHPGAQTSFMNYLYEEVTRNKHQVVMSTHSPAIISQLPSQGIKVLGFNDKTRKVELLASECSPLEAFYTIGHDTSESATRIVFVEDELARHLVIATLRAVRPTLVNVVSVKIIPGGAEGIVRTVIPALAESGEAASQHIVLLDGDKRPPAFSEFLELKSDDLESKLARSDFNFDGFWTTHISPCLPNMFVHSDGSNKRELQHSLLFWAHQRLGFLGKLQPEELILRSYRPQELDTLESQNRKTPKSLKKWWADEACKAQRMAHSESPSSADILDSQKHAVNRLKESDQMFRELFEEIERLLAV